MRFTLAACLALMAFAGVLCFLLTTQPSVIAYGLLMSITIFAPAATVAGIVYGRDNLRAFCIGAALPLAILVWTAVPHLQDIRFDPDAYGWPASTSTTSVPEPDAPSLDEDPFGSAPRRPALSYAHEMTLHRVRLMTGPTCSLSLVAILSGATVMVLHGCLVRKEHANRSHASA